MRCVLIGLSIAFLLSGCTLSEMFTTGVETRGDIEGRTYIAPEDRFRIVAPPMLNQHLSIKESAPAAGVLEVHFEDSLCRRFVVSEQLDLHKGLTLEQWVDQRLLGGLERQGFKAQQRKTVQLRQGPAVFFSYVTPQGAPCTAVVARNGKREEVAVDADTAVYVLRGEGFIYQLMYILGRDPVQGQSSVLPPGPMEDQLRNFAEGFEPALKAPTLPRIP